MSDKERLSEVESQIIAIAGSDIERSGDWTKMPDDRERIENLLESRRRVLNSMFRPTDDNMRRFRAVNERLYSLTLQLCDRVRSLNEKLPLVMDTPDFDDDYEIVGRLRYSFNGEKSVLRLGDDEYYGSDFTLMIKLISELNYGTVKENIEDIGPRSILLDDGVSWDEYPFAGREEFDGIIISHAVHHITNHQQYSIPDLLRLNDFWAEVRLTLQSITEQDGTRLSQ